MRSQAVLLGDVSGRDQPRGLRLRARLQPTQKEVTECVRALVCPLRNGRVALGSWRDPALKKKVESDRAGHLMSSSDLKKRDRAILQ